jgi:hypothetical protein
MPRIPSQIPRIACGGMSFLTLVLPLTDPSCFIETTLFWPPFTSHILEPTPPCLKFVFCAFKVTIGLVRSYVTLALVLINQTPRCEDVWESRDIAPPLLALDGGE